MFNLKIERRIENIENSQGRHQYFYDGEISRMQKTAYNQEVSILALKKEAALQLGKLKYAESNIQNLLNLTYHLENAIDRLLKIMKVSGIIEEVVKDEDLFQFRNTKDMLKILSLHKVNKVVIQDEK